jgi:hypothetical protein
MRLRHPGRSGYHIHISQEQGGRPLLSAFFASHDLQSYSGGILSHLHTGLTQVEITLRVTVSESVCLGVGHPDFTYSFLLLENSFALRLGAPSLTRGRVCHL